MARISKYVEITPEGKYVGHIYTRTLIHDGPDKGKKYVGETTNPKTRDGNWKKKNSTSYGGAKITEARRIYSDLENDWQTDYVERIEADSKKELSKLLDEREDAWIDKLDSINNGFNEYKNSERHFSEQHCRNISKNHRDYQTEETRAKLRQYHHPHTDESKAKISKANLGKKRSPEYCAHQSAIRKGIEPVAASAGLRKYIDENGHGPTKGIKQSANARANMKAAQQARGTTCIAIYPDGTEKEFSTMLDAAKATGHNVGSVENCIKHGGTTKKGFKFRKNV